MKINERRIEATASGGSYLQLSRVWKKGDRVELELPMRLTAEAMPDDASLQAFRYGPIVLAGDLGAQGMTEQLIRHQQRPDAPYHTVVEGSLSGGKLRRDGHSVFARGGAGDAGVEPAVAAVSQI